MGAGKRTMAGYLAVLFACILFFGWMLIGYHRPDNALALDSTSVLKTELREEGNRLFYSAALPGAFQESRSLLFKSSHARVEVSLDGAPVYTYGTEKRLPGKSPGTYWHVVSLPAGSGGRELSVCLTSAYDAPSGLEADIRYGGRGDCILALVSSILPVLVLNFTIIIMGVICMLLFVMAARRKEQQERTGFLCIGLFSLTIAVWSLRQCGFLQFLLPDGEILYFVDIHLLFLVMPPLDLFVYAISATKWKKGFLWISAMYLFEIVLGTAMQMAGIADIFEMLVCLHVLIAFNGVYMFWAIHREVAVHKGGMVSRLRTPLYTLMVFGVLELVTYYVPVLGEISIFLPLGAMVFILMLIWQQVEEHYQSMLEEQKYLYYKKLANTDLLTGASSRNAYEHMLKRLASAEENLRAYGSVLFDVNNLKIINDSCGHEKGDEAIKLCHESILEIFGDQGKCYRIGGDEFVLLVFDEMDIGRSVAAFDELVARKRKGRDFPFSVALGYAVFDAAQDRDIQDTIKRSDAMMYLDKKRKKET